jgi:hypothetical protein
MPYSITNADGTPLVIISDNTINTTSSSLSLIGRNALNFGLAIDQNFIDLLQNFASTVSPINPLIGQFYYNTTTNNLQLFDGSLWTTVVSPFDGTSGTATALIGPNNISVSITIAQNQIITIATATYIPASSLPNYVVISDVRYFLNSLFSGGLYPGINLATGYEFIGTATSANILTTSRNITLGGAINGNVYFDGSSDVNIYTSFSNVYVGNTNVTVAGTYTKVYVGNTGYIIGGGNIVNSDVITALGYVPYNGANISINAVANTIVSRDSNSNFAANLITGTATTAMALVNPIMVGINGDVIGAGSFNGASNVLINVQLAPIANLIPGTFNTVSVDNKGRVIGGSLISSPPLGSMTLYTNPDFIPTGWIICNGQTFTNPSGTFITPNLTNISLGGAFWIMCVQ